MICHVLVVFWVKSTLIHNRGVNEALLVVRIPEGSHIAKLIHFLLLIDSLWQACETSKFILPQRLEHLLHELLVLVRLESLQDLLFDEVVQSVL